MQSQQTREEVVSHILTNLTNNNEISSKSSEIYNTSLKLAYIGMCLVFLLLAVPSLIILNSVSLLLFDFFTPRHHSNICLRLYQKLSLKKYVITNSYRKKTCQHQHNQPIELKHFKYCYRSEDQQNAELSQGAIDFASGCSFTARKNNNSDDRYSSALPSGMSDPFAELDRIEKHLSKSIHELDKLHTSMQSVRASDPIQQELNDLIEDLNVEIEAEVELVAPLNVTEPPSATFIPLVEEDELKNKISQIISDKN